MVKKFGCLDFSVIQVGNLFVSSDFEAPVLPTVEGCKRPCK